MKNGVKTASGIFLAKGPQFYEVFMAQLIMPYRREMASMALAAMIQSGELDQRTMGEMVTAAFAFADEMTIQERLTLDAKMPDYWALYLSHNKSTDDVMASVQDSATDWSLS